MYSLETIVLPMIFHVFLILILFFFNIESLYVALMTWNATQDWAWKHKVLLPLPLECWLKAYTIRSVFLSLKMLTFKFTIKMMFLDNCHYWFYFKQVIEHINYKHAMLPITHISNLLEIMIVQRDILLCLKTGLNFQKSCLGLHSC